MTLSGQKGVYGPAGVGAVLRISIGRYTTEHDIETAAEEIIKVVNELREENPKGGKRGCKTQDIEIIREKLLKDMK